MDTSIVSSTRAFSRDEVRRIYGTYEGTVHTAASIYRDGLIGRKYVSPLSTQQLIDLIETEYTHVFRFPVVHGVRGFKTELLCEDGFAFNTPAYMLVPYHSEVSEGKRMAKLGYVDNQGIANIPQHTLVQYILVSKTGNNSPRISFVDIELDILEHGVPQKCARQYVPDEGQYYLVLSNVGVWSEIETTLTNLYMSQTAAVEKSLNTLVMHQSGLQYFVGRIDEMLDRR